MKTTAKTICNRDCPDACSIVATVEDGRITHLAGDPDHPVTQGFLCYRTSHFLETQYSSQRLTKPLLRSSASGKLLPVSWEEALSYTADKLLQIRKESGPASIFYYRSGGTLGMMGAVVDRFWEHFGPVTVKRGDICSGAGDAAQIEDFGIEESSDFFDLQNAKSILLWGKNPFISSPHLLPLLKDCRRAGAQLALIDPVAHKSASLCQDFVQVRPGGDFALAMAVGQILFAQNWIDPQADSYCDKIREFRALAHSRSLEDWLAEADVSRESAQLLAKRLGQDKPATILIGWGMGRRRNGAAVVRALDALAALTGNLGIPGGGASFYFKRRGAFDSSFVEGRAPRTVCEPLFGREVQNMSDPPIRAVWVTAGNPVAMLPDSQTTADALRSRDLLVVCDHLLTDTAELAHVVFPTTTLLESDDLLGSYGHHYLGVSRPVSPPPPDVKSDLEIIQALAARVGLADVVAGSPRDWKAKMIAPKLGPHGITVDTLEAGPLRNPLAEKVLFADRKFATPSGKVNLIDSLPPSPAKPSAEYPLLLMALSTPDSQSSQWVRPQQGLAELTVHPDSANGIPHGGTGVLASVIGKMQVRVLHDPAQRKDVAIVPKGGHLRDGRCANALTEAALTDLGEGGALYDQPVKLTPL
ncbi:MAG TPA: molybdopterin-dependent oxidoreductase [Pseudomonadota bacterium]|nr:molybdopterin-dependent oxidoreductase [Pseudomonadota bacterium]